MQYINLILLLILFLFIGVRIIIFIFAPLIKKSNLIKVYNPFFFTREKKEFIEIHIGFARDFIFKSNFSRRKLLSHLAAGLLKLIEEIEDGKIELDKIIYGNPYFFKVSNLKNFGFKERDLNFKEKIRFYLNYLELSLLKSIASNKPSLVKINRLKIFYTNARTLKENKNKICNIYLRMNNYSIQL
jgi:hypothetical protein